MAIDPLTGFDFDAAAGTISREEMKTADDHLLVQFFLHPVVDFLLTEGGEIPRSHPRVKELRAREAERLAALRRAEPAPEGATPEQLAAYEEETKQRAAILSEHPENPKLYVVAPAGRPVYVEKEFIRIIKPGDRDSVLEVPADKEYRHRFAARYALWKEGNQGEGAIGTPLRELPFVNTAWREELAFFGVHTAEQLVNMSDSVSQHFMGIRALQDRVRRYIEGASGNSAVEKLSREVASKDAEMQAMRQAIADLQQQLAAGGAVAQKVPDIVERAAADSRRRSRAE